MSFFTPTLCTIDLHYTTHCAFVIQVKRSPINVPNRWDSYLFPVFVGAAVPAGGRPRLYMSGSASRLVPSWWPVFSHSLHSGWLQPWKPRRWCHRHPCQIRDQGKVNKALELKLVQIRLDQIRLDQIYSWHTWCDQEWSLANVLYLFNALCPWCTIVTTDWLVRAPCHAVHSLMAEDYSGEENAHFKMLEKKSETESTGEVQIWRIDK